MVNDDNEVMTDEKQAEGGHNESKVRRLHFGSGSRDNVQGKYQDANGPVMSLCFMDTEALSTAPREIKLLGSAIEFVVLGVYYPSELIRHPPDPSSVSPESSLTSAFVLHFSTGQSVSLIQ